MSVNETVLRRGVPTKVLLHGFMNNGLASYIQRMRDNYLAAGDFNVISVDWSNKVRFFRTSITFVSDLMGTNI